MPPGAKNPSELALYGSRSLVQPVQVIGKRIAMMVKGTRQAQRGIIS